VNSVSHPYNIDFIDDQGTSVTVKTSTLPSFVTYASKTFTMNPKMTHMAGSPYTVDVTLVGADASTTKSFKIILLNDSPSFSPSFETAVTLNVLETRTVDINSMISDPEGSPLQITVVEYSKTVLPSFIKYEVGKL
jgi:hypothetical protein